MSWGRREEWRRSLGGKTGDGTWIVLRQIQGICLSQAPALLPPFVPPYHFFCKQHCSGRKISDARTYAFVSISDPDCRYSENS